MFSSRKRLGELLVAHQLITNEQLEQALAYQRQHFAPLGQILVRQGFISEERLLQVCAIQIGVSAWHLQRDPPHPDALAVVPSQICQTHQLIPVRLLGDRIILAMRDPGDVDAIDMIRNMTKKRVEPVLASAERLVEAISTFYNPAAMTSETVTRLVSEAMIEYKSEIAAEEAQSGVVTEAELRPVVGLVNQIITDAICSRASDVHIEPRRERIDVRYRVDGQLQKVHEIPKNLKAALIARIKIMAQIDIVEYRVPQDGRIAVELDGRTIDIRVSVLPNYHGQRIVLRILDRGASLRQLSDVGFAERNRTMFEAMIRKPYGLLLVTGPTGSGKTTTLYAALNMLKQVTNNIMTCEDPVEYDLDGINQSYVNEKVGLTFAAQLRAILRQDPDVILVGEIRDKETAETAIRAALTGHMVLSTLHCNDAASTIPRLTDMGIEPFLLSTALIGVTGQRLVRILCPNCKKEYAASPEERILLGRYIGNDTTMLFKPTGCSLCDNTGYRGRMGIHEVLPCPPEVQQAIAAQEPLEVVRHLSARFGYRSMQAEACDKVLAGLTSTTEVQRSIFFETAVEETLMPRSIAA